VSGLNLLYSKPAPLPLFDAPTIMTAPSTTAESATLIAALHDPARYPHAVTHIEVLETHISWVILTGPLAYKIKKPVNLGFLDFTTLDARRHCCEAELRLNRRFAPALYEDVVRITGTAQQPQIDGGGTAIEYAVRMREFPQQALASRLLPAGALAPAHIDALAARLAGLHATAGVAAHGSPYGTPDAVIQCARENFEPLARLLHEPADASSVAALRAWTEAEFSTHWSLFQARQRTGWVRECHGDLHLGNIVMQEDELTPFDCIEFNPALRWIDVVNEIAFLVMDLLDRGSADLAWRVLNAYFEAGGDYAGIAVLRFYLVYRALVRAKVHALRSAQDGLDAAECQRLLAAARGYIALAERCAADTRPAIILLHGLSGSGKSVFAQALAQQLGAIRLRSDVERKRLRGLAPAARTDSALAAGLYTEDVTRATYNRLLNLARSVVNAGYTAIVDATFLRHRQRDLFRRDAAARGVPGIIVALTAPEAILRSRIAARLARGGDASEADPAVLTYQLAQLEALDAGEAAAAVSIDTTHGDTQTLLHEAGCALSERLATRGSAP
jgi:uncharacterized protein